MTAFCSTEVIPDGTQIITRGRLNGLLPVDLLMKCLSMISVVSKSAMTPSRRGRVALVLVTVAAATEFFAYPGNWTSILTYAPVGRSLLLLRTATMPLAIPVLLWPEGQGFPQNVWSSRIRGTLKNRPGQEGATGAAGPQSPAGRRNT